MNQRYDQAGASADDWSGMPSKKVSPILASSFYGFRIIK